MNEYQDLLTESLQGHKEALLEAFRKQATLNGWPSDIIENIDLSVEDGNISLVYDNNLLDTISVLEYGNVRIPAKAAIRNFTAKLNDELSPLLVGAGVESMLSKGIFS